MFYSERLNLLFIASPKTGSTSVESYLSLLDPEGERFRITLENRIVDSSHVQTDSLGHATAAEFEGVLGAERFGSLRSFGFVRHPMEKLVSAYFYTRKGSFLDAFNIKTRKSKIRMVTKRLFATGAAKVLPFSIWALVFPMKKCSIYFLDSAGRIMVDCLGSTNRLNKDLEEILSYLGIAVGKAPVPHVNQSRHSSFDQYVRKDGILYRILERRYADDLELYALVESGWMKVED